MGYIKVPKVFEKLKKAEELYSPVIMMAGNGYGKSAAVDYFYRRKNPVVLRCKDGEILETPDVESIRGNVFIVEDMQWLSEEESINYLRKLLNTPGLQVVMLTRGCVPKYLASEDMEYGFVRIQEKDFVFGEKEVAEFFEDRGVPIHPDDIPKVTKASGGYVCAIYCYTLRMENGERYSEDMKETTWQDMYRLWDGRVYVQWSDEFTHFALSVCRYDEFTREMAEYLTGNKNIGELIEYCRETMSQLSFRSGGCYSIRPEVRKFYCWKQTLSWSKEEIQENYRRAADYYEMKDDIPNALKYYKKAHAYQRVKELLIRNANTHPGNGHYVETKEYYLELPREELKEMPVLMAGMSMLYDLILMPEKSDEWYYELEAFERNKRNSREKRKEARTRLAYLDIALPHKGTKGILRVMRNVFTLMQKGDVVLPEFAATGNMPSVMNGGLDFCEWSKSDIQIAKFMGKPVEKITGKFGNGLVTVALAESGFEKGTMSQYEVLTRCNDCFEKAAHGGKIEMCFVAVGIQVRQHIVEGQLPSAKRTYESFLEKAKKEGANQLLPNLEAFNVWLNLFGGTNEKVREYIESIPEAKVSFCILDRYRQMVKLRSLIAENRLEEALDLSRFLTGYFVSYERYFHWMENEVLKAVILNRLGDSHWKTCLHSALKKAEEYHFVRLVSIEGTAVLPLIIEMDDEGAFSDIDEEFINQVRDECFKVASFYPDYLNYIPKEVITLTKRENQVLSMLCAGMSMDNICKELGISYDGLKKHNKNIYKKLGVKRRAEAERKASQLGLVFRGE